MHDGATKRNDKSVRRIEKIHNLSGNLECFLARPVATGDFRSNDCEEEQQGEEMSNTILTPKYPEGTRYPIRFKVDIDPQVRITQEYLKLPHIVQVRGDFCEEMAEEFATAFHLAENTGQEIIPIVIDSYGGDVYALMSMIDVISNCKVPVATIVTGKAMSAGAVLASCGTEGYRFCGPNATIMIHSAWQTGISGNPDEVKVNSDELIRLNKRILEILSKNCGHQKDYFFKIMSDKKNIDWFIQPKDALKHNIINHIKLPEFSIQVKMSVNFG